MEAASIGAHELLIGESGFTRVNTSGDDELAVDD